MENREQTIKRICEMFEAGFTYQAIGDFFSLSRERIRQLLNNNYSNLSEQLLINEMQRKLISTKKHYFCCDCGKEVNSKKIKRCQSCRNEHNKLTNQTKEQRLAYIKHWQQTSEKYKEYLRKNRKRLSKYHKDYLKRPEVIEHKKEYIKEYLKRPGVIERRKGYMKKYYQKQSTKDRLKLYYQNPKVKARVNKRHRERYRLKKLGLTAKPLKS